MNELVLSFKREFVFLGKQREAFCDIVTFKWSEGEVSLFDWEIHGQIFYFCQEKRSRRAIVPRTNQRCI